MKRIIQILSLLAFASVASAQQATLNTPVTRTSEDNYKVAELLIRGNAGGRTAQVLITVSVQDSGGNEIRYFNMEIPRTSVPSATVAGFVSALITIRATETGSDVRKANFRALGYFKDQGYPELASTTLVP